MFDIDIACVCLKSMGIARECLMNLEDPNNVTFVEDKFFNIYVKILGVTVFEG